MAEGEAAAGLRCAAGDDVAYTSAQIGHTDARFALRVYTQATKRRERLSGAHLRAYETTGRSEGHERAQTASWSVCWLLLKTDPLGPNGGGHWCGCGD